MEQLLSPRQILHPGPVCGYESPLFRHNEIRKGNTVSQYVTIFCLYTLKNIVLNLNQRVPNVQNSHLSLAKVRFMV